MSNTGPEAPRQFINSWLAGYIRYEQRARLYFLRQWCIIRLTNPGSSSLMKIYSKPFLLLWTGFALACQPTTENQRPNLSEVAADTASAARVTASTSRPLINQRLSPADFATKLETLPNEQLIDVRTPAEYQTGHLAHSALIDFKGGNFREKMAQLDKHQPVMVYCAAGGRSTATVALLEELGFTEVYELEGGITRWQEAGQEIEQ